MTSYPNRFFHGFCSNNGNNNSHFRQYIIESVHDISDYEGGTIPETIKKMEDYYFSEERVGEPYYVIYGSLKTDFKESSKFIAAFEDLKRVIELVEHLTGNKIEETDLPVYK